MSASAGGSPAGRSGRTCRFTWCFRVSLLLLLLLERLSSRSTSTSGWLRVRRRGADQDLECLVAGVLDAELAPGRQVDEGAGLHRDLPAGQRHGAFAAQDDVAFFRVMAARLQ